MIKCYFRLLLFQKGSRQAAAAAGGGKPQVQALWSEKKGPARNAKLTPRDDDEESVQVIVAEALLLGSQNCTACACAQSTGAIACDSLSGSPPSS